MSEGEEEAPIEESFERRQRINTVKWIARVSVIASLIMFAGLISALIVSSMDKFWVVINLPKPFLISTMLIILSSVTIYLALQFAKKNNQKLLKVFMTLTLLLAVLFCVFQVKGWIKLRYEGNVVSADIFNSYGSYGSDFTILKNGEEIKHNGADYTLNDKALSDFEVQELREFAHQISGDAYRETLDMYQVGNYGNPYTIKRIAQKNIEEAILEFKENKVYADGVALLPNEQKDLFRFAFGVFREMPFFVLQGEYGKDFSLRLNNEILEFENRRFYYPERELLESEIYAIDKNVFQGGKDYKIKEGKIFLNEKEVNDPNFETYIDLNHGIQVHVANGEWTQMRQELNAAQYSEFYQASNVASSYIWMFTVLHILHVLIGLVLLSVIFTRTFKGYYNQNNQLGISAVGIVWHFLGALWVVLYVMLQFFH